MKWIKLSDGKFPEKIGSYVVRYKNGHVDSAGFYPLPKLYFYHGTDNVNNLIEEWLDESNDEVEQLRDDYNIQAYKLSELAKAQINLHNENEQLREDIKVLEDWNEQCSATYDEMLKENESLQSQLNQYREALEHPLRKKLHEAAQKIISEPNVQECDATEAK
jgi:predicted nuclease with TOPRIM domain